MVGLSLCRILVESHMGITGKETTDSAAKEATKYPNNMRYMDAFWIKIANSYSKWTPIAGTQSLRLCGHSSIELRNTSTGKSAAAFRRERFKFSILGWLFLQQPLPWTELDLPAGLSPSTQGTDNPAVAGEKCSGLHLHFRLAFCKSAPKPLWLQIAVQGSGDGLQVETSQYWKFKAVSSEGSCRFSSWCVA